MLYVIECHQKTVVYVANFVSQQPLTSPSFIAATDGCSE